MNIQNKVISVKLIDKKVKNPISRLSIRSDNSNLIDINGNSTNRNQLGTICDHGSGLLELITSDQNIIYYRDWYPIVLFRERDIVLKYKCDVVNKENIKLNLLNDVEY